MVNWYYAIIAYAFFFSLCVALMVNDRIHKKKEDRDKIGKDILFCFLGALFFPVVVYIGLEGLYYNNRPKPIPKKLRKNLKKDLVIYKGETMPLSQYNASHKKQYTLEQVYGKRYVKSLTPQELSEINSVGNTLNIDSELPDDEYTHVAKVMAKALQSEDMNIVYPLLADDVQLVSYEKRTLQGKQAYVDYWNGVFDRIKAAGLTSNIEVIINGFCGHAVVLIKLRYDKSLVLFHVESGKIKTAVIAPEQLQPYAVRYYDLNRPRLDYNMIMHNKGESIEAKANRMPCLLCGRLSENLDWYELDIDSGPYAHSGQVSICPQCHTQAEYYPEMFIRKDMDEPSHLHGSILPHEVINNPYTTLFIKYQEELNEAVDVLEDNSDDIDKSSLLNILGACKIEEGYRLSLKLPNQEYSGDVCRLYAYCEGITNDNIFDKIYFDCSEMGAWNAYLLRNAHTILPAWWHGGYDIRTYIMSPQDLQSLFNGQGIIIPPNLMASISPTIKPGLSDDTYIIECCYWNDWEGLVRERISVHFSERHTCDFSDAEKEVLFEYECGIRF